MIIIPHLSISSEHGSEFKVLSEGLTRTMAQNMVKRGTFFLNWDLTDIGMQTPIIHINLQGKKNKWYLGALP